MTLADVALKNSDKSSYIVVRSMIFDVTTFISKHPGTNATLSFKLQLLAPHPQTHGCVCSYMQCTNGDRVCACMVQAVRPHSEAAVGKTAPISSFRSLSLSLSLRFDVSLSPLLSLSCLPPLSLCGSFSLFLARAFALLPSSPSSLVFYLALTHARAVNSLRHSLAPDPPGVGVWRPTRLVRG